jgi:hypothetical protein
LPLHIPLKCRGKGLKRITGDCMELKMRELILDLAARGKLFPQNPLDEDAKVLLTKICREKDGIIKKQDTLFEISKEEELYLLPGKWGGQD